jgi:hypothetical protein
MPIRELLIPTVRRKVEKGILDVPRGLIDLADVEARTSILLNVTEVDEIGSDKVEFGQADLAVSKLEPYLGKVLRNDPAQEWIGSTEWLLYRVSLKVADVQYMRYLLLLPEMLEGYRCLQSGKRHARFVEEDFLDLRVPDLSAETQREISALALAKEMVILDHRRQAEHERDAIDSAYHSHCLPPNAPA